MYVILKQHRTVEKSLPPDYHSLSGPKILKHKFQWDKACKNSFSHYVDYIRNDSFYYIIIYIIKTRMVIPNNSNCLIVSWNFRWLRYFFSFFWGKVEGFLVFSWEPYFYFWKSHILSLYKLFLVTVLIVKFILGLFWLWIALCVSSKWIRNIKCLPMHFPVYFSGDIALKF